MEKTKIVHRGCGGGLWIAGWLFTIGFLHLTVTQGFYAIVLWPYYIGIAVSPLLHP